ncbi:MAG: PmoA family protein [Balneolales bacterium]
MDKYNSIGILFGVPIILALIMIAFGNTSEQELKVNLVPVEAEQRVDVIIDGNLFTSYIYTDTIPVLKKPVLFPLQTSRGTPLTRGYPLNPRAGERIDHPHQVGFWLNYGDVNGLDFWNNSDAIPADHKNKVGTIRHREIKSIKSGEEKGILEVGMNWLTPENEVLLKEDTKFIFRADGDSRIIDRITTLTATDQKVRMKDNKEGMMAVRVARELEHTSSGEVHLTGQDGLPMGEEVVDNTGVTGVYRSSEGLIGDEVWATRAPWVALSGTIKEESITMVMFDHPENPGYPTYWHARGYGLFSANPLGQKEFSGGEDELNLVIEKGESITFRYRLFINSGDQSHDEIQKVFNAFISDI